jgi:O-antigen/teichoic acid export membrane protein
MAVRKNILFTFGSQIYVILISIAVVPLYIAYMGIEAYGLVGFFIMLQAWFTLLDMGLTPTLARETARFHAKATEAHSYLYLVRSLEIIFFVLALVGAVALSSASFYITHNWLRVEALPIDDVQRSIYLMSVIVALRWVCSLYRGIISGSELFAWLGCYNCLIATLRFLVVLLVLRYLGDTIIFFFGYQLLIAVVELIGLMIRSYKALPKVTKVTLKDWNWHPLASVLKFSFTLAFTSSVWVVATQVDKLILSKILLLSDYAYYSLAVLVASGIMIISGPIGTALMPRLSKLEAEGNKSGITRLYRNGTQIVSIISSGACVTIFFYAEQLLYAWTGDRLLAHQAAPILVLYSIGNAIVSIASFPYILQYAKGNMHFHLIVNIFLAILLVPLDIWFATRYGGVGTGSVWLGLNLLIFIAWVPLVHNKYIPGLNSKWYTTDTLIIILFTLLSGYLINLIFPHSESRLIQFILIVIYGFIIIFISSISSSYVRQEIRNFANKFRRQ